MKELRQHAEQNNLSISQLIMANEVAVSGKSEAEINAFLDKVAGAMLATVKAGLSVKDDVLPGPIKLHSKAATVWERAQDDKYESDRAIALVSACALAASEENARGHASTMRRFPVRRAAANPRSASLRPCPPRSSPRS
jgi:L-serine dehydratase